MSLRRPHGVWSKHWLFAKFALVGDLASDIFFGPTGTPDSLICDPEVVISTSSVARAFCDPKYTYLQHRLLFAIKTHPMESVTDAPNSRGSQVIMYPGLVHSKRLAWSLSYCTKESLCRGSQFLPTLIVI